MVRLLPYTSECLSPESESQPPSPELSRNHPPRSSSEAVPRQADLVRRGFRTAGSLPAPLNYTSGYVNANRVSQAVAEKAPRLHKRLILCCDGTWNNGLLSDSNQSTNVLKLARCIFPEDRSKFPPIPQIVFYQTGLGTADGKVSKWTQGATGYGIQAKIREAYAFISQNYIPGDEVFLFGFSRGAFTARTIASMIADIGILNTAGMKDFYQVFSAYQARGKGTEETESAERFLDKYREGPKKMSRMPEGTLKCVGVWDTVGALGLPGFFGTNLNLLGFRDTKLSRHLKYAFHAIAIHEMRKDFTPTKWERSPLSRHSASQVFKQVWFSGVHSDVGGGYQNHDLSDVSLIWMVANLIEYKLLSINEEYLCTLPSPHAGWGKMSPNVSSKIGMIETVRKLPTEWDPTTAETIHPSVAYQANLSPELSKLFERRTLNNMIEELLPFEIKMRKKWDTLRELAAQAESNSDTVESDFVFTDFLKTLHRVADVGRLMIDIFRGQTSDEELAEQVLTTPVT